MRWLLVASILNPLPSDLFECLRDVWYEVPCVDVCHYSTKWHGAARFPADRFG